MECFRIDESGYTGFDLLNPEQRFQGAAAIAISDDDAARLIKAHFPRLQAPELKYRALSRRPGSRPDLLALLRDLLQGYKCVTHVMDKRFMLVLKFCDYAVEPWYHERGADFYADGQNYAMGSLLTILGPTMLGAAPFEAMLAAFQLAMRAKTPESLDALVAAARRTNWQAIPEAIGPLARDACPDCLEAIATPGVTTDLAMVTIQALISRMEVMADGPYRVEHDESKNLAIYHDLLQAFIDHTGAVELRQSAIASFKFPLKLTALTQVDSKTSPAIQLADVMIGAALEAGNIMTGHRTAGLDPEALLPLFRDDQLIHMLPSLDFEAQKAFRKGAQASQVIDYFAANFAGKGL
ncbi:MAG: DUF3800 domain-containing protein [Phenylobacterium sp.]|uniref:DUF3800 domain-containing protein n=1 Tax=Phenylobacterium sp. TaxID=1871053 RepID=UPI002600D5E9|nr:DUF3800 domain-containing protein [Phenylobacterium sp.]MBT9470756.1 DUF3800 domain-containing protein [Phenylobacterium sp.]